MPKLFFCYSHSDEQYRNELEVHLAMLKREGLITTWHDRRIDAGKPIDHEIDAQLEASQIVLLLVSSYFLNSDYCYDREMMRALERHKAGDAVVIPVIVHPCDWKHAPFGRLRATPPDGKPISKFPNIHDAYFAVATDVRKAIEGITPARILQAPAERPSPAPSTGKVKMRSSNLRIKREFSDKEHDDFIDATFEYIGNFFEESLEELRSRNVTIETKFKRIDRDRFAASVYRAGEKQTSCRVWLSSRSQSVEGISYSSGDSDSHGINEALTIEDDGYSLVLRPLMGLQSGTRESRLTEQGAAELLWSIFIGPLQ
jgi:TIR domain